MVVPLLLFLECEILKKKKKAWASFELDREKTEKNLVHQAKLWKKMIEESNEQQLLQKFDYKTTSGVPKSAMIAPVLLHVFNHGTLFK